VSIDELLHELRQRRLILISDHEIWPSPLLTQEITRALKKHRKGLTVLIRWADINVCPSSPNHRKYWRYVPGEQRFECEVCRRIKIA
jgi:hypothetical protein